MVTLVVTSQLAPAHSGSVNYKSGLVWIIVFCWLAGQSYPRIVLINFSKKLVGRQWDFGAYGIEGQVVVGLIGVTMDMYVCQKHNWIYNIRVCNSIG